jgi:hypothetical protein
MKNAIILLGFVFFAAGCHSAKKITGSLSSTDSTEALLSASTWKIADVTVPNTIKAKNPDMDWAPVISELKAGAKMVFGADHTYQFTLPKGMGKEDNNGGTWKQLPDGSMEITNGSGDASPFLSDNLKRGKFDVVIKPGGEEPGITLHFVKQN